jgi:hypothetical protein
MCTRSPRPAGPPPLTAEEKAEQEAAKQREKDEREAAELKEKRQQEDSREKSLEAKVKKDRKGSGAQSLLSGGKGGIGYFDETL